VTSPAGPRSSTSRMSFHDSVANPPTRAISAPGGMSAKASVPGGRALSSTSITRVVAQSWYPHTAATEV